MEVKPAKPKGDQNGRLGSLKSFLLIFLLILVVQGNTISGKVKGRILTEKYFPLLQTLIQHIVYFLVWALVFLILRWNKKIDNSEIFFISKCQRGPWRFAILQSFFELSSSYLSSIATQNMNSVITDIFKQGTLIFTVFWSFLILKKRYTFYELAAIFTMFLTILGKVLFDLFTRGAVQSTDENPQAWNYLVAALSRVLGGLSHVIVELICRDYEGKNEGKKINSVTVLFFTSAFQFLLLPVLMPLFEFFRAKQYGMGLGPIFRESFLCLFNLDIHRKDLDVYEIRNCQSGWQSMGVYLIFNLMLNLVAALIINFDSAVSLFMGFQIANIVGLFVLSFQWFKGQKVPMEPTKPLYKPAKLHWSYAVITPLIVISFVIYKYGNSLQKKLKKENVCCYPLRGRG